MSGRILLAKKKTSRCLVQGVERKVCYKLKETLTNKHKEESEDCDKAEKVRGAKSNNRKKERGTFITITRDNSMYYQPTTLLQYRIFEGYIYY